METSATRQGGSVNEPSRQCRRADVLDAAALAALDRAAESEPFDTDILSSTPARDMGLKIAALVSLLEKLDHRDLLARQGFISRLTGADVEARLNFELATEKIQVEIEELRRAAKNARHTQTLLEKTRNDLIAEQQRLDEIIDDAKHLLSIGSRDEAFLVSRFERRLSNIMAIHAANIATIEQISLGMQVLMALIDRYVDVETMLLPLWQRNTLALAHAAGTRGEQTAVSDFEDAHNALIRFLKQDEEQ